MAEQQTAAQKVAAAKAARLNKGVSDTTRTKLDKRIGDLNVSGRRDSISKLQQQIASTSAEIARARRTAQDPYGNDIGGHMSQYIGGYEGKLRSYQSQIKAHQAQVNKAEELEGYRDTKGGTGVASRLSSEGYAQGNKIEQDILRGTKFGESVLGEEGLGRLQEDEKVVETLDRFEDISRTGLSSKEVEAERARAFSGIDRNNQTAIRGLQARLARSGVKGATAGQQMLQAAMEGSQQKTNVERDIFLKSADIKREGLKDFSQRLGDVKTFDLSQAAREKDIVMQSGFGFAQLGNATDVAKLQAEAQKQAAMHRASAAPSCFHPDMEIDGRLISELSPGDVVNGDTITGVTKNLLLETMYNYHGVIVTGSHYVFDEGSWKVVKDATSSVPVLTSNKYTYNLTTMSGTILIDDVLFSDQEGAVSENVTNCILGEMNGTLQAVSSGKV